MTLLTAIEAFALWLTLCIPFVLFIGYGLARIRQWDQQGRREMKR